MKTNITVYLNSTQRSVDEILKLTSGKVELGPYELGQLIGWATIIRDNTLELRKLS